jgi:hypothetical protein
MGDTEELEQLIRVQIDEPVVRELQQMYHQGLVSKLDVDKFRVSARRYKAAVLTEHKSLDPAVRHELVKSLLSDYQATINKLVLDIAKRVHVTPEMTIPRPNHSVPASKSGGQIPAAGSGEGDARAPKESRNDPSSPPRQMPEPQPAPRTRRVAMWRRRPPNRDT